MNLSQLYEKMRTITEKNKKVIEAKEILAKESNEESKSKNKGSQVKKLPQPTENKNQDSTS